MRCSPFAGFSFGAGRASKKASSFDAATLSLNGFWRAHSSTTEGYDSTTGTWDGVASAGGSGSRNLTQGTAGERPAAGTAINGLTPPDFDGTDDNLESGVALSTFVSASAWFAWALVNIDAIALNSASSFSNDAVLTDLGLFWGIFLRANGGSPLVYAYQWDGAEKKAQESITTGGWNLICARYDGTNIRLRVNAGTVQTAAAGNITTLTNNLICGAASLVGAQPYNGRMADVGLMSSAESDSRFDDIKAYVNSRYGLAL